MSQSLVKNLVHLVYSTKYRQAWYRQAWYRQAWYRQAWYRQAWIPPDHRDDLYKYQAGRFQEWESPALIIGGVEDHVHALFSLSKNHALKKVVEEVKKGSSKWMKTDGPRIADFSWQNGYARFSVSPSKVVEVKRYIDCQEEHHRKMTFQDELRAMFRKHGIEFDERYVWD